MFKSDSNRPQFIIEQLDARRLLSVTIAADEEAVVADPIEVVEATIDDAVIEDDVLMYKGAEGEGSVFEAEILTCEEPLENLEDLPPADGEPDLIRYTLMPGDNERDVEILTLDDGAAGEEVPSAVIYSFTSGLVDPADSSSELPLPPAKAAATQDGSRLFESVIDSSSGDVLA